MSNNLFQGIFDTDMTSVISISDFLLCVGCALIIGVILAGTYMYGTKYTKSFAATLALLLGGVMLLYNRLDFGTRKHGLRYKTLHITIPEDLDYSGVFDKILKKYTTDYEVDRLKQRIWEVCLN